MTYEDTRDSVITVDSFSNSGIDVRISAEQQNYTRMRANQTVY
jgi:hypothetical protein